ncbi:hypothetical protein BJ165DRAFT_1449922 [Panaeolus papilionaceus]|nr:hypothetical protein BJ165DRAFT_1449922 [Panaeolus papilionaceus]
MLLASWHTLRSSRPLLNRTFVAYSHHHTLTLNTADHNIRASHRQNYSVDLGPSHNAFPIDVLDAQASFRTFCALVEEDRLEEAKVVMRDAVEAAPTPAVMFQFKKVLLDTPEKTSSLIVDLASIFASKGEHQVVRDDFLPILRKVAGPDVLQELDALLSAPVIPPQAGISESVFEDLSVDYENIRHATAIPKPSIMELVQKQLPALLPDISADGSALFEEDEGYAFAVQSDIPTQTPLSSGHFLLRLIEQNQLDKAYQLLRELRDLGTPIPKSPAYEVAVLALISASDLTAKERRTRILAWLPLLPDRTSDDTNQTFKVRRIARQLNNLRVTDLELLTDFALTMSGKGYISTMTYDVVPTIVRYSDLEYTRDFLNAICEASMRYNDVSSVKPAANGIDTHIYSTAVRTLARSRRSEDAFAILLEAAGASIRVTKPTVDILLSQLRQSKKTELISRVEDLVSSYRLNAIPAPVLVDLPVRVRKTLQTLTSHMPSNLRLLKRGVVLGTLPEPKNITNFMHHYTSSGRRVGLTLLLQKALNNSFFSSNVLLFSEMMIYNNLGHHSLVLETFMNHFHLTGVPREEVLAAHRRMLKERKQHTPSPSSPSLPRRIISASRIVHPRGKLWPTIDHCDLVWAALVHYAESCQTLDKLYMKLLRYAQAGVDGMDDPSIPSTASLMAPLPHEKGNDKISRVAFTPFIRPMMHAFGEGRGVKILNDMVELGITPTAYHYTELAAFYSSNGMTEKAFLVLDHMEQQPEQAEGMPKSTSPKDAPSPSPTTSIYDLFASQRGAIPKPDLTTYVAIIRGFIISRDVEAATEVLRRLCLVHEYVPGEDSYLDTALVHLHELKTQGATWVPKRY